MWSLRNLMIVICVYTVYLTSRESVHAAKILMLPVQLYSHISNFVDIGEQLVKHGHEVYTASYEGHFEVKNKEIKTVKLPCRDKSRCSPEAISETQASTIGFALKMKGDITKYSDNITEPIDYACREILIASEFFTYLESLDFDLVFVDGLFVFRCLYLVPHRLGVPWVTLTDFMDPLIPRLPWLPSFVPHSAVSYSDKMTFMEKLQNLFLTFLFHYMNFMPPLPNEILEEYSKFGPFNSLKELEMRSLLWLYTHDNAIDYPRPYMPNVISVGGVSTKPAKKLQNPFKQYLESSNRDIVIVSFGSYLVNLPDDIATKFLEAFSRLPVNIIWRFKNKNNLIVSENVFLTGWLPQNDLLAHDKVKVFVTHCGNNGMFEALYHGKPMLAVPILGDQLSNAAKLTHLGFGLKLNIFDFTSETVVTAIEKLLENSTYMNNIKKASAIFHDQQQTPSERAAYWINHVIKHGGKHLRSHALDMPLHEYFMLDIFFVVGLIVFIVCYSMYKIICCLYFYLCKRKMVKMTKIE